MVGVKSYANITLMGGFEFGKNSAEFPANPKPGATCFKDGVLYIFASLGGFDTWYPLNRPQASYVHSQGVESLVWTINHGLETTDVVVAVYDEAGKVVGPSVESLYAAENPDGQKYQVVVRFTEATAGVAVVFGASKFSTPAIQAVSIDAQSVSVNGKPVATQDDLDGLLSQDDGIDCGELA